MRRIISLSGLEGSGKNAVGAILAEQGFQELSFSSALKDALSVIFGWPREMLEGRTDESRAWRESADERWSARLGSEVTPRSMMQRFGTEVMRETLHRDIWVLALQARIENETRDVVVTDARFFNELRLIRDLGGQNWGIYRNLPTWLPDFYRSAEAGLHSRDLDRNSSGGLMGTFRDGYSDYHESMMVKTGRDAMRTLPRRRRVHVAEWQHLLWPHFDRLIDNRGSMRKLRSSVASAL